MHIFFLQKLKSLICCILKIYYIFLIQIFLCLLKIFKINIWKRFLRKKNHPLICPFMLRIPKGYFVIKKKWCEMFLLKLPGIYKIIWNICAVTFITFRCESKLNLFIYISDLYSILYLTSIKNSFILPLRSTFQIDIS